MFGEPEETINNNVVPSQIPKEETSLQNESEPEKTSMIEETNEPAPPKKVPKNIVTSWADWVAKTASTSASVKETKKQENIQESQDKRYDESTPLLLLP